MILRPKDGEIITRGGVTEAGSVLGVPPEPTTRLLSADETERVRARYKELRLELGSQQAVEDALGISQQSVGKYIRGVAPPSMHAANMAAAHDRLPVEILLSIGPGTLYAAMRRRRWKLETISAVASKVERLHYRINDQSVDWWVEYLHRVEKIMDEAPLP